MSTEENKRIVKVMLEDLFCETAYRFYGESSGFEGHMIDYSVSPLHGREAAENSAKGKAPHQIMNLRDIQRRSEKAVLAMYPDGNCRAITSLTAEGKRVVAEYFVHGGRTNFRDDREHNFHCVKVFELEDQQVINIREYIDSAYLMDFSNSMHTNFGERIKVGPEATAADLDAAQRSAWGSSWLLKNQWFDLGHDRIGLEEGEMDANKRVAAEVAEQWGTAAMFAHMADHILFSNQLDLEVSPNLGKAVRGKAALEQVCRRMLEAFPTGMERRIRAITAEENRVCVEDVVSGTTTVRPDKPFATSTLKIMFLRAGKVFRVRQYVDSGYLRAYSQDLIDYAFGARDSLESPR